MKIEFPLRIDVVRGAGQVGERICAHLGDERAAILLVTGVTYSKRYAAQVCDGIDVTIREAIHLERNHIQDLGPIEAAIVRQGITHIVAIGGGRVCDFAKRLALLSDAKLLTVPTIIANDGLISPISVLKDDGLSVSLPGKMPDAIFIDLALMNVMPKRFFVAAACDLVSNISATNDWSWAADDATVQTGHLAYYLARMAAYGVIDCCTRDTRSERFLRQVIFGQVLSGMAMGLAGSSRPCSGAEHLICHAIDVLGLANGALHGLMVASATRFCLHLQSQLDESVAGFLDRFEIKRGFVGCGELGRHEIENLFAVAKRTRPGRSTILDAFTDEDLARRYFLFCADKELACSRRSQRNLVADGV